MALRESKRHLFFGSAAAFAEPADQPPHKTKPASPFSFPPRIIAAAARVVKSVDTRDLNNLSLRGETPEVKPVKFGESPGCFGSRANAEPSPSNSLGRCREQTAGTYGREAMVKACSRPRTPCVEQGGGESRSGKKIPRRKACRFDSGLGHQSKAVPAHAGAAFPFLACVRLNQARAARSAGERHHAQSSSSFFADGRAGRS